MKLTPVYIITRARIFHLERSLPHWEKHGCEVTLVIDPAEEKAMRKWRDANYVNVNLFRVSRNGIGMGAIRQEVLQEAASLRQKAFIMSDDDLFPAKGNIASLCEVVLREKVVGCGASNSYHGLMLGKNGNKILKGDYQFPISSGFAHRCFALNTVLALKVGGFPAFATCLGEDDEMQRRGIAAGYSWWYDTSTSFTSLAKRFTPGGLADAYKDEATRRKVMDMVHRRLFAIWPKFVSNPATSIYRCYWKRMMNEFIPDWEKAMPKNVRDLQ